MQTLTSPSTSNLEAFTHQKHTERSYAHLVPITQEQREASVIAKAAKAAYWATLDLRQNFVDEKFMRGILRAANVRCSSSSEPASPMRIKTILRRTGMQKIDIVEAVGVSVEEFLLLNPNLPLWAALSAILESTGKYDKQAEKIVEDEENSQTIF